MRERCRLGLTLEHLVGLGHDPSVVAGPNWDGLGDRG